MATCIACERTAEAVLREPNSDTVWTSYMALALLCALACAQSSGEAGQYEGNAQPDYWYWAAKIRSDVKERSTFDKVVPPKSSRESTSSAKCVHCVHCARDARAWRARCTFPHTALCVPPRFGGHYSDAGTDVKIGVRFFKVMAVEAAKGTMKLKVWLRYSWVDARLAWEPEEYGGVTTVYYQAMAHPGNEDNEIWIPDLQPYNAEVGIQHTLDTGYARVSHDGSVFYSRPGTLETLCKFSGLVAFPFDQLRCQLEFGGWLLSGAHQGIQLDGEGYQFSLQEASSGTSYQEYTIKAVNVSYGPCLSIDGAACLKFAQSPCWRQCERAAILLSNAPRLRFPTLGVRACVRAEQPSMRTTAAPPSRGPWSSTR